MQFNYKFSELPLVTWEKLHSFFEQGQSYLLYIMIFYQVDVFKDKIKTTCIGEHFDDFDGKLWIINTYAINLNISGFSRDYKSSIKFIKSKYVQSSSRIRSRTFTHETCATGRQAFHIDINNSFLRYNTNEKHIQQCERNDSLNIHDSYWTVLIPPSWNSQINVLFWTLFWWKPYWYNNQMFTDQSSKLDQNLISNPISVDNL